MPRPSSRTRIEPDAAVLDVDRHVARAGVERVFDEFLDDGGRALDDLAGGDLVDEGSVKDLDRHGVATGTPV